MYKEVLQGVDNVAIWPIISFVIFFTFFIVLLWWALTVDRGFVRNMSELPLEDGTDINQPANTTSRL